jgi:hypothetical protein
MSIDTKTKHDQQLIDCFVKLLPHWTREGIEGSRLARFAEAYLIMAGVKYRPAAPSDGCGNIQLSPDQFKARDRLYREAVKYAVDFYREEDSLSFWIGCSNFNTNRAFVLSIEAARLLAGCGETHAVRLLELAIKEIKSAT